MSKMFSYKSDSSCITTNTQDERIELYLKHKRNKKLKKTEEKENIRRLEYEETFNDQEIFIFHLAGLDIVKFSYKQIQFWFTPSIVHNFVSRKIRFYCSLIYELRYSCWRVRRDTFPVDVKREIYDLMYSDSESLIEEQQLMSTIERVYDRLVAWSQEHGEFRRQRQRLYENGELEWFQLDFDDEELMTDERRDELHEKKDAAMRKIMPPKWRSTRRKAKPRLCKFIKH